MSDFFENVVIAAFASSLASLLILATRSFHGSVTLDSDLSGAQKFHNKAVPRIGGAAFVVGLAVAAFWFGLKDDGMLRLSRWAAVAMLPVFLGGFLEDIKVGVTPRNRLMLSLLSATIAFYELDARFVGIGHSEIDEVIINTPGVSLILSMVMVGGLSHAANIIDGFNGLLIGIAMAALIALSIVAHGAGNDWLVIYMGIVLGALAGVFLFNFPFAKLFLGDGGAYLIGFLLAFFALLVTRNPGVSPWVGLLILSYPVMETLFSIGRKSVSPGKSPLFPDREHLHMLVYQFLVERDYLFSSQWRNPATTMIIWLLGATPMFVSVWVWRSNVACVIATMLFSLAYVGTYWFFYKSLKNRKTHRYAGH